MKTISKKDFDKIVTKQKLNTVIEFYAPWCEPCREMADVLAELCCKSKSINFYKINTDDEHELTYQNAVMSIPTIIYFKSGNPEARSIGICSKEDIKSKLEEIYN